jgi:site-specific recombinase XerD
MLDDLRIRNYAASTVECYIRSVAAFAKHFRKSPDQLGPEEIRQYQLFLLNEKKVKLATYIQAVAALRFFYRNTLHHKIDVARDGRFLINTELDDTSSEPIHLLLNWRPPAK